MKMLLFLLCLFSLTAFAQDATETELEETAVEEVRPEEQQEAFENPDDTLHPYGETNDWSLGGEDLASEDYE